MAEHKVKANNDIIYIIPSDELFEKWKNGEAFIDEYGRLMNRRPHRVLKELKAYGTASSMSHKPPTVPVKKDTSVADQLLNIVSEDWKEISSTLVDYTLKMIRDKLLYEGLPKVKIHIRNAIATRRSKASDEAEKERGVISTVKPSSSMKMTAEEANAEKRKVFYHWLEMLSSLKKLHEAGEIDIHSTLVQLMDPVTIEYVNGLLRENPNILETDRYIELRNLLGRDLYKGKMLIPIEASEIKTIVESYGYEINTDGLEDEKDSQK